MEKQHYQSRYDTAFRMMYSEHECKMFNKLAAYVAYYRDKVRGV